MKVLLAIDGSLHSQTAVAEIARRPWPVGTEVEILTVIHPAVPLLPDPAFVMAAIHVDQATDLRRHAPTLVSVASEQLQRGARDMNVTTKIVEGAPKDLIVQEAREWGADLIVVGSHGRGRVRSVVLGSVARAVVTDAPCSVLVARAKRSDHRAESTKDRVSGPVSSRHSEWNDDLRQARIG